MLRADSMPRSYDTALEQGERGFYGVGRDHKTVLISDVFIGRMIHGLALGYLGLRKAGSVEHRFVGHDHINILADVLLHDFTDRLRRSLFDVDKLQFAIALDDSDYDFFVVPSGLAAFSYAPCSDIGFINFDRAIQHLVNFGHGEADSVTEIPCGFVADSKSALDLIRAHALLCFTEQQGSEKPLLQGQMAIVEYRARRNAKLIIAAIAVEQLFRCCEFNGWHLAAGAFNAIRPTKTYQQFPATFIGIEHPNYVN